MSPFVFASTLLWSPLTLGRARVNEGAADRGEKAPIAWKGALDPEALPRLGETELEAAAERAIATARLSGESPGRELGRDFPGPERVLAMLSNKNDLADYIEYGAVKCAAGEYYRAEAELVAEARKERMSCEAAYSAAYRLLLAAAPTEAERGPSPLAAKGELSLPARRKLKYNHTYALDVFFAA